MADLCYNFKKEASAILEISAGVASTFYFGVKSMRNHNTTHSHIQRKHQVSDFIGHKFGRLTPKMYIQGRPSFYLCVCDCGNTKRVQVSHLSAGYTRSCGCYQKEKAREQMTVHGHAAKGSVSPESRCLSSAIDRCYNKKSPNYKDYGARGITVCDDWTAKKGKGYIRFIADMGMRPSPDHSLDRIDNNKGYSKENCRWATAKTQQRNTRYNRNLTFNNRTLCLAEWSEVTGITWSALYNRLRRGWVVERILTTPLTKKGERCYGFS